MRGKQENTKTEHVRRKLKIKRDRVMGTRGKLNRNRGKHIRGLPERHTYGACRVS